MITSLWRLRAQSKKSSMQFSNRSMINLFSLVIRSVLPFFLGKANPVKAASKSSPPKFQRSFSSSTCWPKLPQDFAYNQTRAFSIFVIFVLFSCCITLANNSISIVESCWSWPSNPIRMANSIATTKVTSVIFSPCKISRNVFTALVRVWIRLFRYSI